MPTIYAFGDSIIDGHMYWHQGSVERTAASLGDDWTVVKRAHNGASISPTTHPAGQIIAQCDEIPDDAPKPDVIVFNGLTNDIYHGCLRDNPGQVLPDDDVEPSHFDRTSFAGCFEATLARFRELWPGVPVIYLAVHKNGALDYDEQLAGRAIILAACRKWGAMVADVWQDSGLDTRRDEDRVRYTFDRLGSDGLPGTPETITYEDPKHQPSGTHPNFPGIDAFYIPVLAPRLLEAVGRGK